MTGVGNQKAEIGHSPEIFLSRETNLWPWSVLKMQFLHTKVRSKNHANSTTHIFRCQETEGKESSGQAKLTRRRFRVACPNRMDVLPQKTKIFL